MSTAWRQSKALVLVAALTAMAITILNLAPLAALAIGSLRSEEQWGLGAFRSLGTALDFAPVMLNSWAFALGTTAVSLVLGVSLAFLTSRTDLPATGFVRGSVLAAFVSPPWLLAMAYVFLASPNAGLINQIADAWFGVKPLNVQSLGGMIAVSSLFLFSFVFLVTEGALSQIDGSFEEAARAAGAGLLRTALRVTLPLIAPTLIAASVFSLIIAWGLFAIPAILGMPARVYVFSTQLYLLLSTFPPKYETAAALGMVFAMISLLLGAGLTFARRSLPVSRFAVVAGKGRRPATAKLGYWRPIAVAYVSLLIFLAVLLPFTVVAYMALVPNLFGEFDLSRLSLANFSYLFFDYGSLGRVTLNSLMLAGGESVLVLAVAMAATYLVQRTAWPVGRFSLCRST
ncbi:MAG: ABC transporter permease subunit [Burkholderiales bacterium]